MAAAAKGKRRVKGKTVDLNSFLGNQSAAPGFVVVTPKRDWADCVEDESEEKFSSYRKEEKIVLPTAPKAARGPDFDISKIPSEPPFTAYIGNLPFDITEDEIIRFFGNLNATSVRLPRDGGDRGRMKGFGYAVFETKQDLIEALSLNGESLKNRPVRVSLAGENENVRVDRKNDVDRTASDWRAAPKSEDSFSSRNQRNNRYDDNDREPYRGRNSYEDRSRYENGQYQGRRSTERERDFNYSSSDRDKGGYNRRYGEGGFDSHDRNRGYDRGPRSDRRDDFESRRDDRDFGGYNRRNDRKEDQEFRNESEQDKDRSVARPRLQLKPRSVPIGEQADSQTSGSSIFGGAKPVDTAAKEREIEKRLAKEREKQDNIGSKPFSERDVEQKIKKEEEKKNLDEEPLKEKTSPKGEVIDKPPKSNAHQAKGTDYMNTPEQENGKEQVEFLSNKFSQLSSVED